MFIKLEGANISGNISDQFKIFAFKDNLYPNKGSFPIKCSHFLPLLIRLFDLMNQALQLGILIGRYHPLDGITNLKYTLLCFLTYNKKIQRERHLLLTGIDAAI
jgi:hypothetical protein